MPTQTTVLATIGAMLVFTSAPLADDRAPRLISAFENWMSEHDVSAGAIAVIEETGNAAKGYGGQDPDAPVTLASLSKAVTGDCIAVLQQEGVFDLTSDIADLTDIPGAAGQLSDFLSHSSGLGPDRTQGQPWHLSQERHPRHVEATEQAFRAKSGKSEFRYNNENYAVLGAVIDAVAQVDYATDCRQLVLEPLGIATAQLDPVWAPHGAWGGWAMSVKDYARFVKEWFGTPHNIGREPRAWPHAKLGKDTAYVMGTLHRTRRGQNLFWHAGALCWNGEGDGSYFVSYGGNPVVVVSFKACISDDAYVALDKALFNAALK